MTDTPKEKLDDWVANTMPFLQRVMKLKGKMKEKNLTLARAYCIKPCDGFIVASIARSNGHIRASCTRCGKMLIE